MPFIIAFKNYNMALGLWDSPWVGLKNFKDFIYGVYFWDIMRNTIIISLYKLLFGFSAPIVLAVVAVSVTPESEVLRRGIVIIPESFTFIAYKEVFISHGIGQAYKITLFRTIVGTALNVFFTVMAAYPLSKMIPT